MGAYGSPERYPITPPQNPSSRPVRRRHGGPVRVLLWSGAAIAACMAVMVVAFTVAFCYFAITSPPRVHADSSSTFTQQLEMHLRDGSVVRVTHPGVVFVPTPGHPAPPAGPTACYVDTTGACQP